MSYGHAYKPTSWQLVEKVLSYAGAGAVLVSIGLAFGSCSAHAQTVEQQLQRMQNEQRRQYQQQQMQQQQDQLQRQMDRQQDQMQRQLDNTPRPQMNRWGFY